MAGTSGLTLAEYVRRGFFELVTVAALVLPMLLGADWMVRKKSASGVRFFRILSATLVGLLFVIMASALQRMRLYTESFGLTELCFYVTAFMLFLAVVFVWFGTTVLRGRREVFAGGALAIGLTAALAVQAVNPDAWIARTNLERAARGQAHDLAYLTTLGGEAVSVVLDRWSTLGEAERRALSDRILLRWPDASGQDWRTWNAGEAAARRDVETRLARIRESR